MKLHHLGIAVISIEAALKTYRSLFSALDVEFEPARADAKMKIAMIKTRTGTLIELLEPLSEVGDIGRFIARRGEGFHHVAYEVDDIHAAYENAKNHGLRVLGEIERGAGECDTFFIHPKDTNGVLTEFVSHS